MSSQPRILIVGNAGQVGVELQRSFAGFGEIIGVDRESVDLADEKQVRALVRHVEPAIILNAAAYTAVDRAESELELAHAINAEAPRILAEEALQTDALLVHYSTDYVFDGTKASAYVVSDPVAPTGVYGASKLAGETAVLASGAKAIVLRTAWVYAPRGKNFVLTMLNVGRTRDRLTVVADQEGCPTSAEDLADVILAIADRIARTGWEDRFGGVFHAAGTGGTSWHGLACAVFDAAGRLGMKVPEVAPIATADWPTPAKRPANSRLDCGRLATVFGLILPHWRGSVERTVAAALAGWGLGAPFACCGGVGSMLSRPPVPRMGCDWGIV